MNIFEQIRVKRLSKYGLSPDATYEDLEIAKRIKREEKALAEMRRNDAKAHKRFEKKVARDIKIDEFLRRTWDKITALFAPKDTAAAEAKRKAADEKKAAKLAALEAQREAKYKEDYAKYQSGAEVANAIYAEVQKEADALKAQLAAEVARLQAECEEKATAEGISIHKSIAIRSKYAKQIDNLEDSVKEDIRILLKKADKKRKKVVRIGECSGNVLPPRPVAKKLFYISMERRNVLEGYICILPFIIGTLIFFAYPIFLTIKLSFGEVVTNVGFDTVWLPITDFKKFLTNYNQIFFVDQKFLPYLWDELQNVVIKTPLIIVFSLILAMLINKNIKGKGFFRVVFFLPFLLGTGQVLQQLTNLQVDQQVLSIANSNLLPTEILSYISEDVMEVINQFFQIIVLVLWNSGVQILLFLSGLQSISSSLYEAARVDGATEWEQIWKITIPMLSPIMLLNFIYTIVASFTDVNNALLSYMQQQAFQAKNYEYVAAMGWTYFMFILAIVGVVALVLGLYVRNYHSAGVGGKKKHGRV